MYSDSLSKSEILNKQYQSVFTKKSTTATPRLFGNKYPLIGNLYITLKGVQKLLEKINISIAAGPDLIPGRRLNMLAPEICMLFLLSVWRTRHSTGYFDTENRCLAQFLTELLRILSFKTCIMKN